MENERKTIPAVDGWFQEPPKECRGLLWQFSEAACLLNSSQCPQRVPGTLVIEGYAGGGAEAALFPRSWRSSARREAVPPGIFIIGRGGMITTLIYSPTRCGVAIRASCHPGGRRKAEGTLLVAAEPGAVMNC